MRQILKNSTAIVTSVALLLAPVASVADSHNTLTETQIEALRTLLSAGESGSQLAADVQALLGRVDQLEALANRVAELEARARTDADRISGFEAAIATMAQSLSSVEALGQQTAELLQNAEEAASQIADGDYKALLDTVGGTILDGETIGQMADQEVLEQLRQARAAAQQLRDAYERQGQVVRDRLRETCNEVIPPEIRESLGLYVSSAVPQVWTPDIAATALEVSIPLPDCFDAPDENDRTPRDEVLDYLEKRQASQEMATAMNSMMMAAMATGNPYIIAAAVAIMVIMAIFSDNGGGGGGEGEGSGDTEGEGQGEGQDQGQGQGQSVDASPSAAEDAGSGEAEGGDATEGGSGVDGPPAPPTQVTGSGNFENVELGLDTIVNVSGQVITLTDLGSGTEWAFEWQTEIRPLEIAFPPFSDNVRIMSADAVERTITVQLYVPDCSNDPTVLQTYSLKADENDTTRLVVDVAPDDTCIDNN